MRYARGSIIISDAFDVPLLLHVRNCRFVSRSQLFNLLQYEAAHLPPSSYTARLNRLVRHDYIRILSGHTHRGSAIYSIAPKGLLELESHGEFSLVLHSQTRHMPHPLQVHHCVELTDIRLVLMGSSWAVGWKPEVEVASENLIRGTYQKDYDAVVRIQSGQQIYKFALEYERTLKAAQRYLPILLRLQEERQVQSVVYMTPSLRLAKLLFRHLTPNTKPLAFTPVYRFRLQLLATPVMTNLSDEVMSLGNFFDSASSGISSFASAQFRLADNRGDAVTPVSILSSDLRRVQ